MPTCQTGRLGYRSRSASGRVPPWVAQEDAAAGALRAVSLAELCQQAPALASKLCCTCAFQVAKKTAIIAGGQSLRALTNQTDQCNVPRP